MSEQQAGNIERAAALFLVRRLQQPLEEPLQLERFEGNPFFHLAPKERQQNNVPPAVLDPLTRISQSTPAPVLLRELLKSSLPAAQVPEAELNIYLSEQYEGFRAFTKTSELRGNSSAVAQAERTAYLPNDATIFAILDFSDDFLADRYNYEFDYQFRQAQGLGLYLMTDPSNIPPDLGDEMVS